MPSVNCRVDDTPVQLYLCWTLNLYGSDMAQMNMDFCRMDPILSQDGDSTMLRIKEDSAMVTSCPKKYSCQRECRGRAPCYSYLERVNTDKPSFGPDFIPIKNEELRIGRNNGKNDIVIPSIHVSKEHCIIKKGQKGEINKSWWVTNLSKCQTFLNGQFIEVDDCVKIKSGDILQLTFSETLKYVFHQGIY